MLQAAIRLLVPMVLVGLLSFCGCSEGSMSEDTDSFADRMAQEVVSGDARQGCDDGNPCTDDVELADGTCKNLPIVGFACDDENACTSGDSCNDEGVCGGQENVDCDDGNSCTVDSCDPASGCVNEGLADGADCQDGSYCTVGEVCQNSVCVGGTPVDCSVQDEADDCVEVMCNPASGECDKPEFLADGHPCKDGNPCTDGDSCDGMGDCIPGVPHDCPVQHPCKTSWCNKEANEGTNPCVQDWVAKDTLCDDNNACTDSDGCQFVDEDRVQMKCTGLPLDCNDENPCSSDSCNKETGCAYTALANGTPCNKASDPCAVSGACEAGECVGALGNKCDDNNPCTDDGCFPETGECSHEYNTASCDDGNECTTADICVQGVCAGSAVDCAGIESPCLQPICNPASGVCDMPVDDGTACPDADLCNGEETCLGGACTDGEPVLCEDDGNECIQDVCVPETGQCGLPVEDGLPCGDGNVCDGGAVCKAGVCVQGEPIACPDDGNACVDDVCNPLTGQCGIFMEDGTGCEDGSLCTDNDVCQAGQCHAGTNATCDDSNMCTDDICIPETGCDFQPNGLECEDGSKCTVGDLCVGGECIGGEAPNCDDGKECTGDSCNTESGCVNANVGNGTPCGQLAGWTCLDGECQCQQDCQGKVCGDDGCGGNCGECPEGKACQNGQCNCVPDCTGKECGDDGCGGECGPCVGAQEVCIGDQCVCQPACAGKQCGTDGCGGDCGSCDDANDCTKDTCNAQGQCEHEVDDNFCTFYFYDGDDDGFGVDGNKKCLCEPWGKYTATQGGDCDDKDEFSYPDAAEICDGGDNDCDNEKDEEFAVGQPCDSDDSDKCENGTFTCTADGKGVECINEDPKDIIEICNSGLDEDCDGLKDENEEDAVGCVSFYFDADEDGFGVDDKKCLCEPEGKYAALEAGDCNDEEELIFPGAWPACTGGCSDGVADETEECDDGNTVAGDGCDKCKFGEFQLPVPEVCTVAVYGLAAASDGKKAVVVWSCDTDTLWHEIFHVGVALDPNTRSPLVVWGPEAVPSTTYQTQFHPDVAMNPQGNHMAVWMSHHEDGQQVYGRCFDEAGIPMGDEFHIPASGSQYHRYPKVTWANSGFLVVWAAGSGAGLGTLMGRLYSEACQPIGGDIEYAPLGTTGLDKWFDVSYGSGEQILLAWSGQTVDDKGLFGRLLSASGSSLGQTFPIAVQSLGYPVKATLQSAVFVANSQLAVAYAGFKTSQEPYYYPRLAVGSADEDVWSATDVPVDPASHINSDYHGPVKVVTGPDGVLAVFWNDQKLRFRILDSQGNPLSEAKVVHKFTQPQYTAQHDLCTVDGELYLMAWTQSVLGGAPWLKLSK